MPVFVEPPAKGKYWEIRKPTASWDVESPLICDWLLSFNFHFLPDSKESVPCVQDYGLECDLCGKIERRWEAYAVGYSLQDHGPCFLAITRNAYRSEPRLKELEGQLAGYSLKLSKAKPNKRSRTVARLSQERTIKPKTKVDLQTAKAQLFWIWGVEFTEED